MTITNYLEMLGVACWSFAIVATTIEIFLPWKCYERGANVFVWVILALIGPALYIWFDSVTKFTGGSVIGVVAVLIIYWYRKSKE